MNANAGITAIELFGKRWLKNSELLISSCPAVAVSLPLNFICKLFDIFELKISFPLGILSIWGVLASNCLIALKMILPKSIVPAVMVLTAAKLETPVLVPNSMPPCV
jgi:hypothetical protein